MIEIHKKIVTDENQQPVAVQIDYNDWLEIEKALDLNGGDKKQADLSRFTGALHWGEDAVAYQRRVRQEWES